MDATTFPTKRVGSLMMLKPNPSSSSVLKQISLNKRLVEKKFAAHSPLEAERDLQEEESGLGSGLESSSESSEEETGGAEYNPQPLFSSHQKLSNLQLYVSEEMEAGPVKTNRRPLDTTSLSSKGKGAWPGLERRKEVNVATNSASVSLLGRGSRVDQALKLRESLRKGREAKREEAQQQQQGQSGDLAESGDLWSQFRKERKKGEEEPLSHVMPAGMFVGKRHEDILANIRSRSGAELKEKFAKLVCK